jgi:hypothetical protein
MHREFFPSPFRQKHSGFQTFVPFVSNVKGGLQFAFGVAGAAVTSGGRAVVADDRVGR